MKTDVGKLVILLIFLSSFFIFNEQQNISLAQSTGLETIIQGVVRDNKSGQPIEGILVEIVDFTYLRIFTNITDENGVYKAQVGIGGNYRISAYSYNENNSYEYLERYFNVTQFTTQIVDLRLNRYPSNIHFRVIDSISNKPIQGVEIQIHPHIQIHGPTTYVKTNKNGWGNLTLTPFNYSIFIENPGYKEYFCSIYVKDNRTVFYPITLKQILSGPTSKIVYFNELISIPPNSYAAIRINSQRETTVWASYTPDVQLKEVRLTENMFLEFLEKNQTFEGPVKNFDRIANDMICWSSGRGNQITLWRIPYFLLLFNELNYTIEVKDFKLRWAQDNNIDVNVEIKSLSTENETQKSNDENILIYLIPILFVIILIPTSLILMYKYFKKKSMN